MCYQMQHKQLLINNCLKYVILTVTFNTTRFKKGINSARKAEMPPAESD